MNFPKDLQRVIAIARFAHETGITVHDACELVAIARLSFSAGVRACNTPGKQPGHDKAMERFEKLAERIGFCVEWPGLWPSLRVGNATGKEVHLPD